MPSGCELQAPAPAELDTFESRRESETEAEKVLSVLLVAARSSSSSNEALARHLAVSC